MLGTQGQVIELHSERYDLLVPQLEWPLSKQIEKLHSTLLGIGAVGMVVMVCSAHIAAALWSGADNATESAGLLEVCLEEVVRDDGDVLW